MKALEAAGLSFALDQDEFKKRRVVLRGSCEVAEGEVDTISIVFPDSFPHTRFQIYAEKLRLARHQAPFEGNFCLLAQGSIHWRPSMRAVDLLGSPLRELVRLVRAGGPALQAAEEPQAELLTSYLPFRPTGAILIPPAALDLPADAVSGEFVVNFDEVEWLIDSADMKTARHFGRGLVTRVSSGGKELVKESSAVAGEFTEHRLFGQWSRVDLRSQPKSLNALVDAIAGHVDPKKFKTQKLRVGKSTVNLVAGVIKEETTQGLFTDAWIFLARVDSPAGAQSHFIRAIPHSLETASARIPELAPLQSKGASLIGAGSLGAPIALDLARSHLGKLKIADRDYADPNGAVRWPSGLTSSGMSKAHALKRIIDRDFPFCAVTPLHMAIGSAGRVADNGMRELDLWKELLAEAAVVIDATAEDNVSYAINSFAGELGIPQIYVWSIDGHGGVVARVVPGKTGCFHCLQLRIAAGNIVSPKAATAPLRVQPRGCADPTFTASCVQLAPLSTHATHLALQLLSDKYPKDPNDVFVYQGRNPDGSIVSPPSWAGYRLERVPECPACEPSA